MGRRDQRKEAESLPVEVPKASRDRINIAQALELRFKKHWTLREIGNYFGCSHQAVKEKIDRYVAMMLEPDELEAYRQHKSTMLSTIEFRLAERMLDPKKLDKASLNNLAYSLEQVDKINRLEQGKATAHIAYADIAKEREEIERQLREMGVRFDEGEAE